MRTSKAFSTISYNTDDFLVVKLSKLVERGILDFWAWVEHYPEDDETKKHKHIFAIPSKLYDTNQLIDYLCELDKERPLERPLTCMRPRSSKFADWYLYGMHDKAYLASKGQARKHQYTDSDFKVSDADYFSELRHTIDYSKIKTHKLLVEAADSGIPFSYLVRQGMIPINLTVQYSKAYEYISDTITKRAAAIKVDIETGEILDE